MAPLKMSVRCCLQPFLGPNGKKALSSIFNNDKNIDIEMLRNFKLCTIWKPCCYVVIGLGIPSVSIFDRTWAAGTGLDSADILRWHTFSWGQRSTGKDGDSDDWIVWKNTWSLILSKKSFLRKRPMNLHRKDRGRAIKLKYQRSLVQIHLAHFVD